MQTQNKINMNMLKILSSLMIATLTVGCGGREKEKETRQDTERVEQVCPVPKYKYMDMTELGRLCNSDSVHYKSLMFVSLMLQQFPTIDDAFIIIGVAGLYPL